MTELTKLVGEELEQLVLDAGPDCLIMDFEAAAELLLRVVRGRAWELGDKILNGQDLLKSQVAAIQIVTNVLDS